MCVLPVLRGIIAALVALCALGALAQDPVDPPLAGRPPHYSQLIGRFTIGATINPASVFVEDPLTLRVRIVGSVAMGDGPTRAHLRILPEDLADSFYIEPRPQDDSAIPDKEWEFVWTLRPKTADVREIPSLALAYYSPQVRRYQTARTESIVLEVKPRPTMVVETPRSPPESFLEWDEPAAPYREDWSAGAIAGWFAFLVIAGVAGAIYGAMRNPRASWISRKQDTGRRIEFERACEEGRPQQAALDTLRDHLQLGPEASLADIERAFKRQGMAPSARARWRRFYAAYQAQRFGPLPIASDADMQALKHEARALVDLLEKAR
ncbi:MAG: hypothetical protein WCL32_07205 [Planctomycetota bacterium]